MCLGPWAVAQACEAGDGFLVVDDAGLLLLLGCHRVQARSGICICCVWAAEVRAGAQGLVLAVVLESRI